VNDHVDEMFVLRAHTGSPANVRPHPWVGVSIRDPSERIRERFTQRFIQAQDL
jgi:hypothetical protein